jgi:TPR repeat protein
MDNNLITSDDINYLTQQSAGNTNMMLAGMTVLMDENDDKVQMLQDQKWFQRMSRTISGRNKMTRLEIQQNHEKINAYMTQAISELYKRQCIDQQVIMSLGNQLNELYSEHLNLKMMVGALVSKLNEKIESIDNFHMLIEEISQNTYANDNPAIAICKILSQLDLRTINDERKMDLLKHSMARNNIISDEPVLLSSYLKAVVDLPHEEVGQIYLELSTYKDDPIASVMLDAIENYHFLPDMARMMKNKDSVVQNVITKNSLNSDVEISTNMLFDDLAQSKMNYVVQVALEENTTKEQEQAESLFKSYRLEEAFQKFQKLADDGDGRAMYFMGEYYAWGYKPVDRNRSSAQSWRKKGAEKGDVLARLNYAYTLSENDPQKEDILNSVFPEVLNLANNNDAYAQFELADMYRYGTGTEANEGEFIKWEEKSAQAGFWKAQYRLGKFYSDKRNYKMAYDWFLKAAEQGHGESQGSVGNLLSCDGDLPKYPVAANEWYRKAITDNCGWAANNLALNYRNGNGCERDINHALQLFQKAIELGNHDTCNILGNMYWFGNDVIQDYNKAVEYYVKGTKFNNTWCWNNLGNAYYQGKGVAQDRSKAVECYKKAVKLNNSTAMVSLAKCYCFGYGTKTDMDKATKLCHKAEALGNASEASKVLNDINTLTSDNTSVKVIIDGEIMSDPGENKSGCFITTAVCDSLKKPDDCEELTILRSYRDNWLRKQSDGDELVQEYYRIAPVIVENIDKEPNSSTIYLDILHDSIEPCIEDIKNGNNEQCKERYMQMVLNLKQKYYH